MEEIADCGNADTDAVWVTLDQQPQEVCEGDVNRWGKKKNYLTLKELTKTFHDITNTKDKILEAVLNLERSMAVHQGIETILPLYFVIQLKEDKHC